MQRWCLTHEILLLKPSHWKVLLHEGLEINPHSKYRQDGRLQPGEECSSRAQHCHGSGGAEMLSACKHGCLLQLHTPQQRRMLRTNTPSAQLHRAGEVWHHIFRPVSAPGLTGLQWSMVQLCAVQPNDMICPGVYLLSRGEHLGRKELGFDICGE